MRKKYFTILLLCFIPVFLSQKNAMAYETKVHAKITDAVIEQTANTVNKYFKDVGLTTGVDEFVNGKKVRKWIEEGSIKEDEHISPLVVVRYLNHFYDPLTGLGLTDAPYFGTSSYLWASKDVNNAWTWT